MAVDKGMGLGKGGAPWRLGVVEFIMAEPEPLNAITDGDVIREGFPGLTREDFIAMFTRAMRCNDRERVMRIEFKPVAVDGIPPIGSPVQIPGGRKGHMISVVPPNVDPSRFSNRIARTLGRALNPGWGDKKFSARDSTSCLVLIGSTLHQVAHARACRGESLHTVLFHGGADVAPVRETCARRR